MLILASSLNKNSNKAYTGRDHDGRYPTKFRANCFVFQYFKLPDLKIVFMNTIKIMEDWQIRDETLCGVIPAVKATSAMTLFSKLIANSTHKNVKEPKLLGLLIGKLIPKKYRSAAILAGWCIHYGIGFSWVWIFRLIVRRRKKENIFTDALFLGAFSGLTGILFWKLFLKLHPDPPPVKDDLFYRQLFLAHLVFGIVAIFSDRKSGDISR